MEFTFKLSEKIKVAWGLYKKNWKYFVLSIFVLFLISFLSKKADFFIKIVLEIVNLLFSYLILKSTLNLVDGGEFNPFKKELFPTFSQFWNFIKTTFLVVICFIPIIGLFLFLFITSSIFLHYISPFILSINLLVFLSLFILFIYFIAIRLTFAIYLSVDKNQGAVASVKESWGILKNNRLKILNKLFIIALFSISGLILFFAGIFITYALGVILKVMLYREFSKVKKNDFIETEVILASNDGEQTVVIDEILKTNIE